MNVVRYKVKLIDKEQGTVNVFLSGLQQNVSEYVEKVFKAYTDAESRFGFITEPYVAEIKPQQPEKKEAK